LAHTPSEGFHLLHKDLSQVRRIAQDQRSYPRPFDPPTLLFRRIAESRIPLIAKDIKVILQRFSAAFCNFITEQSQNMEVLFYKLILKKAHVFIFQSGVLMRNHCAAFQDHSPKTR
jgi:hypothetical protein